MVGHGGSSAGSYLADPTSPIPSHCASIVVTSTLRVNSVYLNSDWSCGHLMSSLRLVSIMPKYTVVVDTKILFSEFEALHLQPSQSVSSHWNLPVVFHNSSLTKLMSSWCPLTLLGDIFKDICFSRNLSLNLFSFCLRLYWEWKVILSPVLMID